MILGGGKREDGVKWRVGGGLDATQRERKREEILKQIRVVALGDYMEKVHY
jgi:hypothetical protein